MGMSVQVHEKTDIRGTWAYDLVDGWYLTIFSEHYRAHRCHIKATKNKRFTDTVQFSHNKIMQPTNTHPDKMMVTIADCAKFIKTLGTGNSLSKMQQLVQLTKKEIEQNLSNSATPTKKASAQSVLRVPLNNNNNNDMRQTRSMTQTIQLFSKVFTPVVLRLEQSLVPKQKSIKEHYRAITKTSISATEPAHNTRSRTRRAEAPPSSRTRACTWLAQMESTKRIGRA